MGAPPSLRRLRPGAGVLLALTGVLGACGGSGYRYVENGEAGAYFKVPEGWEVFAVDADPVPDDRPAPIGSDLVEGPWVVVFDAAPDPAIEHVDELSPTHVVGQAEVGELRPEVRDALTLADLRSLVLDGEYDPIQLYSEGNPDLEIVRYEDITTDDGLRGNRIILNVRLDEGDYVTLDQVALVDAGTERLYRLLVKCDAGCYLDNQDEIDEVVDSWTVDPDR